MKRTLALLIVMLVTLAACAGNDSSSEPGAEEALPGGVGGETIDVEEPMSEQGADSIDVDLEVTEGRKVIRRASLSLHAADTRAAFEQIVARIEAAGGFVADATVHPTNGEDDQPQVSMTLRVPAEQLTSTMTDIKDSVDEVVSETQGAEDVTEQFVDLEARLTNLEALEVELRELLTEVRAREDAEPDDILRVFNEVSSVRGQIEQIQGQIDYLSDRTALATLQVEITQTPSAAPLVDEPWSPGAATREALGNLITGLQGAADWAINFGLYVLPMLAVILGPLAVVGVLAYRRFWRRPQQDPAPTGIS
ncbi:MAG: DUF4349 domain-containing protein [Acidimicrobiia bacterium]|jgi:hypothetical protein